jgi:short subunit dehydrogenase-like uncharacterized protein
MDIMTFRIITETMLEKISDTPQREKARDRINYTLNILGQETMSAEAVAIIITNTSPGISVS